jgi:hypothetical protein
MPDNILPETSGIGASFNREDDSWHFYEQTAGGVSRPLQLTLKGYEGVSYILDMLRAGHAALAASAIEAGTGETAGLDPQGESAVGKAETPNPDTPNPIGDNQ